MNLPLLIAGLLLVIIIFVDALWTTFWIDGSSGPIAGFLQNRIWQLIQTVVPRKYHRIASLSGPIIQTIILATWVVVLWIGWTMVFTSYDDSLTYSRGPQPVDLTGRIYYVAFTMSTMGNGDYYPTRGMWELLTALTTFSGMLMITLVVSFVLSVVGGVNQKRSVASQIMGLGQRSEKLVISAWDNKTKEFRGLELQLISLTSQIGQLTEQQLSYPILHRYHGAVPKKDTAPAIAVLDDALTLLSYGVKEDYRPPHLLLKSARQSVESYLETLASSAIYPAKQVPPIPNLTELLEAGIPVVSDAEFSEAVQNLEHRRKLLLGLVKQNNFYWPESSRERSYTPPIA